MTILVDLSSSKSIYNGVTRYALNIIYGFVENGYKDIKILTSPLIFDKIKGLFPMYECIKSKYIPNRNIKNIINLSIQVNNINCDIIFATIPSKYFLFTNKPIVQTIHDLQYLLSWSSTNSIALRFLMPFILLKSKRIIAISNFVNQSIHKHYSFIPKNKIRTIYNSININLNTTTNSLKGKYILFVSRIEETKNVLTLLKAFNLIKNYTNLDLKLVGKVTNYWIKILLPYITENNLSNRIHLISDSLTEEELITIYRESHLLVHPSIAEGFGYTPIEAAILKIPVITTKETALYETTMGLLNYYDNPFDERELADKILEILNIPMDSEKLEYISNKLKSQYNIKKQSSEVYDYLIHRM